MPIQDRTHPHRPLARVAKSWAIRQLYPQSRAGGIGPGARSAVTRGALGNGYLGGGCSGEEKLKAEEEEEEEAEEGGVQSQWMEDRSHKRRGILVHSKIEDGLVTCRNLARRAAAAARTCASAAPAAEAAMRQVT